MKVALTGKREKFCQLVAAGATYTSAYLEAYQKPAKYDRKTGAEEGSRLMTVTDTVLRMQELRRPVLRKFRRRFEYGMQKALEQCEVAWNLAYADGDPRTILKAVEMQAKLAKLFTPINGHHRNGVLDDTSTEVLLAMKRECEVRQEKMKRSQEIRVVNSESIPENPIGPF